MVDPLAPFAEPVRNWFTSTFREATPPQQQGWPAIASGAHTLILAPTGTGKTLSAFLWALNRLAVEPVPADPLARTRVVYVSPLRALAVDVEKNLRAPLQGIGFAAERLGTSVHTPTVGIRTGDTSAADRRRLIRTPPDILITTPESLYLMLTSRARETLANVEAVIIDEIHAMAGTKRGAHLMVSLERLADRTEHPPQRIALSATQRPLDEIARFLGGNDVSADGTVTPRPVTVVDTGARKELQIEVVVPIEDMANLGERVELSPDAPATASPNTRRSIWPSMHPRLLELIENHRSTLVFSNARRLSERLATRLNELSIDKQAASGELPPPPEAIGAGDEQVGRGVREQIVAMCAMDDWDRGELTTLVRRCANFSDLSEEVLGTVLDLLSGTYPSEEFSELRPRIVWDRVSGELRGRAGSQRLAVTNAGTIPDRGLFGVFLPDGTRVGELDEEMVYESRVGETFLLGASTWRIEDITFERVVVTPAPGQPGRMPFWHGDGPGRPLELGRAIGAFVRELRTEDDDTAIARLRERHGLDPWAADNLLGYLRDQAEATGAVPDDRTIVVERFRDEIGDWRVCILTPFGAQVHAPWGMALQARLGEEWGGDIDLMWSDDGIVMRLPEALDRLPLDELLFDPDEVDDIVISRLPDTAMFSARFRECSARALLLPRRRPDQRTPLWQQRQRAADLLLVAAKYPTFPMLLEATRECVNDVFDLPALRSVMTDLRSRRIRMVAVDTDSASPFAQSLLFSWIAVFMYEGDAPIAERRAAALSLDRELLRDVLGAEELRELLDADVLADLEVELQLLVDGRRARDVDELHEVLRRLGPLNRLDLDARSVDGAPVGDWVRSLLEERRAIEVRIAGDDRIAASDDAARLRDAIGVALPVGLPAVFTDPVPDPLGDLCRRYARTHGPFLVGDVARWLGVDEGRVAVVLDRLVGDGALVRGEFRPGGTEREFCDDDVLRQLRRRSLAALRREIEPVEGDALARFLPAWQGMGSRRRGVDAVAETVAQLQGAAIAASVLERDVLTGRVNGYRPSDLDELCTSGEVVWVGGGSLGATDGRVRLLFRDQVPLLAVDAGIGPDDPTCDALRAHLGTQGASFWPDLVAAVQAAELPYDTDVVHAALWDLVWAGEVTNDSLAPVRALIAGSASASAPKPGRARGRRARPRLGGLSVQGPPTAVGRWSLVEPLRRPIASPTERSLAQAHQLLDRYGVLTRETALAEGISGGFAGVYPVLKALEERGEVRRGYFVAGLGAAQFALPGAVDRLRAARELDASQPPVVLAATDPAQPYGASVAWPDSAGRPARSAGAHVVLIGGEPMVLVERGGRSLVMFGGAVDTAAWIEAVQGLVKDGRLTKLEIAKVDGVPVRDTPVAARLEAAGFSPGYRGMTFRG
jgi:ATP-dependent Lhr-like helicase